MGSGRRLARPGIHESVPDPRNPDVREGRQGPHPCRAVAGRLRGPDHQRRAALLRYGAPATRRQPAGLEGRGHRGGRLPHRLGARGRARGRGAGLAVPHARRHAAVDQHRADRNAVRARPPLRRGLHHHRGAPALPVEPAQADRGAAARGQRPAQPAHRQRVVRAEQALLRQAQRPGRRAIGHAQCAGLGHAPAGSGEGRARGGNARRHDVGVRRAGPAEHRLRRSGRAVQQRLGAGQPQPERNRGRDEHPHRQRQSGLGLPAAHLRRDVDGAGAAPAARHGARVRGRRALHRDGDAPGGHGRRTRYDLGRGRAPAGQRRHGRDQSAPEGAIAHLRARGSQETHQRRRTRGARTGHRGTRG